MLSRGGPSVGRESWVIAKIFFKNGCRRKNGLTSRTSRRGEGWWRPRKGRREKNVAKKAKKRAIRRVLSKGEGLMATAAMEQYEFVGG